MYTFLQFNELAEQVNTVAAGVCDVVKSISLPSSQPVVSKSVKPVDLVFVVDESESIESNCRSRKGTKECWKDMVEFVRHLVDSFTVGQGLTHARIGLVTFGKGAASEFKLKKFTSNSEVKRALDRLTYGSGTQTNTKAGLELVESTMLKESNGMRPRSSNVPRVVVVITDGISTPSSQNPTSVATRLRSRGVTILSVGVQGYSTSQLVAMSSFPPAKYTRGSDDFSGLAKVLKSVAETIHDVISQPIVTSKFDRPVDLMILVDESGGITSGCSPS